MGQVMVVTSGKGGTGKTSLCAGIASCLSQMQQKVLCIDADIGLRNLDLALGMADSATVPFTEITEGRATLDAAPHHPKLPQLSLLTAPAEYTGIDSAAFQQLLQQAGERYDWVLIDAPAGIGDGFRLAASYADRALVVAMADPASLRDAARAAQMLRQLGVKRAHLAVNRISKKLYRKIGATVDDVMDQVGLPLLGLVPEDANVVLAAVSGVPLVCYTERGAVVACRHLAQRLMDERVPLMRIR